MTNKKPKSIIILILILAFIITISVFLLPFTIMKDGIDYCEKNNWDGSNYTFPMGDMSINNFGGDWGITCIKGEETEIIIKLVNSIFFWK